MKKIILPLKESWNNICQRPGIEKSNLSNTVHEIMNRVKTEGDSALRYFSQQFDGCSVGILKVPEEEIINAVSLVPDRLKEAIQTAKNNIEKFHSSYVTKDPVVETSPGVRCWRKSVPVEKVGLYIPGGSAPLFSTLLMLGIPARLAGCREIIVCSPPAKVGKISPLILYTANLIGVRSIFAVGGAQAIAAMAYGTETIPQVFKIFGPGNQYVTKAKELVQQDGIAIDMPAGPSEVLVIADKYANAGFIASDLLSQAEHGRDSQVILLTDSEALINDVEAEVYRQLEFLPRRDIAAGALEHSSLIKLTDLNDCIDFSNLYAPEHLIINTVEPEQIASSVINAGSVFLGKFSCESAGDYASGTNHTLPTNRYSRNYSGVSIDSFLKKISFQQLNADGLRNLGPAIEIMAEAESLIAHKNAVRIRLNSLSNE